MKIITAYNYDPSNLRAGGGITYVHNLLKNMLDKGVEVTLLGVKLSENQSFEHENLKFIPVMEETDNWWKFLFKLRNAINLLELSDSDIIHTHHPLVMYPFIKAFPENPKICTFHGVPLDWVKINYLHLYKIIGTSYKFWEKKVMIHLDKIIVPSEYTKFRLKERYPDFDGKIEIIASAVDLNKFKLMNKIELKKKYNFQFDKIVIFIGRLAEIKNPSLLFNSFLLFQTKYDNAALIIVGKGEKEKEFVNYSKKLNLKNVIFVGESNSEKVAELLNCADTLALTSWIESSPTVIKEALACGIPVVSTNVGDVNQVFGKFGEVISSYNESDFSEALISTVKRFKSNKSLRRKCNKFAFRNFSFEDVAAQYIRLYNSLTEKQHF